MAGGPYYPQSMTFDTSGEVIPGVRIISGRSLDAPEVIASLASDRKVFLWWPMPVVLPGGQLKFKMESFAAATSGTSVWELLWAQVAAEANPFSASLTGEGDVTVTWAAGDTDVIKASEIDLNHTTVVGANRLVAELKFDATSSLAAISHHLPWLEWED